MKKGFLFKAVRVVIVLILAIGISILLVKLRPKAERQVRTEVVPLVETREARAESVNMIIQTYGTVKPRKVLKLVVEVRGQVIHLSPSFVEGGFFKKGASLIQIDPRTYQLEVDRRSVQVRQAQAELKRLDQEIRNIGASKKIAESDLALARTELSRQKKLSDKKVVAQTVLDSTEQRYLASRERLQSIENLWALTGPRKEQALAQLDMTKVLLKQARLDLERTRIVAPFEGWVLEKNVEVGQHVNASHYLGSVYRNRALDIEARIPTRDLKWLPSELTKETGPEAEIIFSSSDVVHTWKGHVSRAMAKLDEKTRTLPVVVEVDEPFGPTGGRGFFQLRPGMFVTVYIKGLEIGETFVLPRHLVHQGDVIYVVKDNHLAIKAVSVLRSFKDSVFVEKGLSEGELVVTTPLPGARDGMKVRVKNRNDIK